jgi:hypothetical protein
MSTIQTIKIKQESDVFGDEMASLLGLPQSAQDPYSKVSEVVLPHFETNPVPMEDGQDFPPLLTQKSIEAPPSALPPLLPDLFPQLAPVRPKKRKEIDSPPPSASSPDEGLKRRKATPPMDAPLDAPSQTQTETPVLPQFIAPPSAPSVPAETPPSISEQMSSLEQQIMQYQQALIQSQLLQYQLSLTQSQQFTSAPVRASAYTDPALIQAFEPLKIQAQGLIQDQNPENSVEKIKNLSALLHLIENRILRECKKNNLMQIDVLSLLGQIRLKQYHLSKNAQVRTEFIVNKASQAVEFFKKEQCARIRFYGQKCLITDSLIDQLFTGSLMCVKGDIERILNDRSNTNPEHKIEELAQLFKLLHEHFWVICKGTDPIRVDISLLMGKIALRQYHLARAAKSPMATLKSRLKEALASLKLAQAEHLHFFLSEDETIAGLINECASIQQSL